MIDIGNERVQQDMLKIEYNIQQRAKKINKNHRGNTDIGYNDINNAYHEYLEYHMNLARIAYKDLLETYHLVHFEQLGYPD